MRYPHWRQVTVFRCHNENDEAAEALAAAMLKEKDRSSALESIDAARAQAVAGGSSAATTVTVNYPQTPRPSGDALATVATEVTSIVAKTLDLNWGPELCTSVLLQHASNHTNPADDTIGGTCRRYLEQNVKASQSQLKLLDSFSDLLSKTDITRIGSDQMRDMAGLMKQMTDFAERTSIRLQFTDPQEMDKALNRKVDELKELRDKNSFALPGPA